MNNLEKKIKEYKKLLKDFPVKIKCIECGKDKDYIKTTIKLTQHICEPKYNEDYKNGYNLFIKNIKSFIEGFKDHGDHIKYKLKKFKKEYKESLNNKKNG